MPKIVGSKLSLSNPFNLRSFFGLKKNEKEDVKLHTDHTLIQQILLMIVSISKKIVFVDPDIKAGIYLFLVLFGSIMGDVLPIPGSYFSRKDNMFNLYFVKLSWGWTMISVGSFVYLVNSLNSCGDRSKVRIIMHMMRLIIATGVWYFWTNFFVFVEERYGYCNKAIVLSDRKQCVSKGHSWNGFSISGHAFILIYCTLIIMEEAKALVCWEAIKDYLRNEECIKNRRSENKGSVTQLESLSSQQLFALKEKDEKLTPYVRLLFVVMTVLASLWDIMLMATIVYFHSTLEKFVASVIAVLFWFITYRFVFSRQSVGVPLPSYGPGLQIVT